MRTVSIGTVQITALLDAPVLMNPEAFMPAHAEGLRREYGHEADERGLMPMAITCFLVRSAGKTVLVDTGLGPRKRPGFPRGRLPERLAEAGIAPADIDVVVHTHLHVDHVGWNTVDGEDGKPAFFFPRAEHVVQQAEWDHWMRPEFLDRPEEHPHLLECVLPLKDSGRLRFTSAEQAFDEHLTFISTPGHTPGHVAIGVASAGERAVIAGDASHHPVQLAHPDWSPVFDADPALASKSRDALFDLVADGERTWLAGHWPYPGLGRIVRLDGKRVFRAL